MTGTVEKLPHWDVSNVFPGLDTPEYETAYKEVVGMLDDLETYLERNQINRVDSKRTSDLPTLSSQTSDLI